MKKIFPLSFSREEPVKYIIFSNSFRFCRGDFYQFFMKSNGVENNKIAHQFRWIFAITHKVDKALLVFFILRKKVVKTDSSDS